MRGDESLVATFFIISNFLTVLLVALIIPGEGKVFPTLLFVLPSLLLLSGRRELLSETVLRKWFIGIVTACMVGVSVFWWIYARNEREPWERVTLERLARFNSLIAFILVLLVFYVTRMMIKRREAEQREPLSDASEEAPSSVRSGGIKDKAAKFCDEIRQHSFLCLVFFLIIFLYVTYFMSFALAFHDQGSAGPGLMTDIIDPERNSEKEKAAGEESKSSVAAVVPPSSGREWHLCFEKGSSELKYNARLLQPSSESEDGTDPNAPVDLDAVISAYERAGNSHKDQEYDNTIQLARVVRDLSSSNETTKFRRARITVLGRSTDDQVACDSNNNLQRYKSNFELSVARAYQVQYALASFLGQFYGPKYRKYGDLNLEWALIPIGNESVRDSEDPPSSKNGEADPKLCTEVQLSWIPDHVSEAEMRSFKQPQQHHRFELFDYIYFMIYTITTTGYGDIKPVSAEAKFFASIANLYELFFLVIFVNVLLSFNRPEGRPSGGPSPASNQSTH